MKFITRLKMRAKLSLMLALPLIALLYFSFSIVWEKSQISDRLHKTSIQMEISLMANSLVHELQKERGMTAGYMGSKGKKFANELPAQRRSTDASFENLTKLYDATDKDSLNPRFRDKLESGMSRLDRLDSLRQKVNGFSMGASEAIGFYTQTNSDLLASITATVDTSVTADLAARISAYVNFLQAKERAGIERAVLSNVFANNAFEGRMYEKLLELIAQQSHSIQMFNQFATPDNRKIYSETMTGRYVNETQRMRKVALERVDIGNFNIEPTYWFEMQTGKIDLLKKVDDQLGGDAMVRSEEQSTQAQSAVISASVVALLAFFLSITGAFVIARDISKALTETVNVAEALAAGDLSVTLKDDRRDELGDMAKAFNKMIKQLFSTVSTIKENSETLMAAAQQVNSSAQTLSQGSSEQAASVEETSASLEQMNASINQNAENSKVTNQIANESAKEAQEGGTAVSETVNAMNQIAEKVSLIEDIAYKTNLLALNAAIEAARAGEHGKGFAVVADEVRKLAERSQVSAQEISEQADASVQVARRAGELLEKMVPNIKKTADLVEEITAASQEQSSGVDQVNKAMEQLDQVSQTSAASSEELAATAEELSGQAEQLQQAVAFFNIGDGNDNANKAVKAGREKSKQRYEQFEENDFESFTKQGAAHG